LKRARGTPAPCYGSIYLNVSLLWLINGRVEAARNVCKEHRQRRVFKASIFSHRSICFNAAQSLAGSNGKFISLQEKHVLE
jgi:hypothetical protein